MLKDKSNALIYTNVLINFYMNKQNIKMLENMKKEIVANNGSCSSPFQYFKLFTIYNCRKLRQMFKTDKKFLCSYILDSVYLKKIEAYNIIIKHY